MQKGADISIRPSLISCINYNTGIIRIEKFQINFTLFSNTLDLLFLPVQLCRELEEHQPDQEHDGKRAHADVNAAGHLA